MPRFESFQLFQCGWTMCRRFERQSYGHCRCGAFERHRVDTRALLTLAHNLAIVGGLTCGASRSPLPIYAEHELMQGRLRAFTQTATLAITLDCTGHDLGDEDRS